MLEEIKIKPFQAQPDQNSCYVFFLRQIGFHSNLVIAS